MQSELNSFPHWRFPNLLLPLMMLARVCGACEFLVGKQNPFVHVSDLQVFFIKLINKKLKTKKCFCLYGLCHSLCWSLAIHGWTIFCSINNFIGGDLKRPLSVNSWSIMHFAWPLSQGWKWDTIHTATTTSFFDYD